MTGGIGRLLFLCLIALSVTACGGDDDPELSATTLPTATAVPAEPTAFLPATGSTASDGVCRVTIPDDWVDDGTGRGTTAQGHRWLLFGNFIAGDAAWESAKSLLRTQMERIPETEITDDGDRITATTPTGARFVVRQRFDDRYCELSVTALPDAPDDVRALWQSVAATLAPVTQ